MKLLKWLAELRLFWFQCMYSSLRANASRVAIGCSFCLSLISFIMGVCAWGTWDA